MPLGVALSLEGLLLEDGRHLYLRMDDGGGWRIEAGWSARKLVGQRVRIEGTRDGFDLWRRSGSCLSPERSESDSFRRKFRGPLTRMWDAGAVPGCLGARGIFRCPVNPSPTRRSKRRAGDPFIERPGGARPGGRRACPGRPRLKALARVFPSTFSSSGFAGRCV
ncbi:DUF5818 domain-containing protein [Sphingomonas sp. NIBR02145]|uniref:DUF5818 domain-containing protein n=1 Tax=Sphingomonas sp. NIBR02145 TaxID=3014784 RepID=UPI00338F1A41